MAIEVICEVCGKRFTTHECRVKKRKSMYCSRECFNARKSTKQVKSCPICGKKFNVTAANIRRGKGKYCSTKCSGEAKKSTVLLICENCGKPYNCRTSRAKISKYCSYKCRTLKVKSRCEHCGKTFYNPPSSLKRGHGKFCSITCKNNHMVGENNPFWRGGISFAPYCPKFNHEFKERVRNFFNRTCQICGKTEEENGRKLPVHHVNYEKMVCCDNTPPLFVTTCMSCHARTNHHREYWEYVLTEYVMIYFDGESYLPL